MSFTFGPRRGVHIDITDMLQPGQGPLSAQDLQRFEALDLIYRSLCAMLFNYVPTSGHPGGSISSGPLRGRPALRRPGLRHRRAGPRGRRHHLLRRRPQGDGPLRACGRCATRSLRIGDPGAAPGRRAAPAPPRGPPRLPPQPDHDHAALPAASAPRRSTAIRRRPRPSSGWRPAPRASAWRARIGLAPGRARLLRRGRAARPHRRGRGRADPGPGRRGAGRRRHRRARTTSSSTSTGIRPRSTATTSAATATRPATTSSGTRRSWPTCTTGT